MMTVFVLWLRQLKRYMRSRARIIGALAQPLLYLATFGFGFASVFAAAGRGDYFQFLVPGIVGMSIIFTSIFSGMSVMWDRQFGFLKEILVAPVSRMSVTRRRNHAAHRSARRRAQPSGPRLAGTRV